MGNRRNDTREGNGVFREKPTEEEQLQMPVLTLALRPSPSQCQPQPRTV